MKKLIFVCLVGISTLYAASLNSIALMVNDQAITTFDIEMAMKTGLTKKQAVDKLIDKALYDQEIEKHGVFLLDSEYEAYLNNLARQNGMSTDDFKAVIAKQYGSYQLFEMQTRNKMLNEKMIQAVARGNIKIATDEDMKIFYDKNKEQFSSASVFDVVEYASKNKIVLESVAQNPMLNTDLVTKSERRLDNTNLNPQIKYLLNATKVGSFTPALRVNDGFVMLYLKDKSGYTILPFEEVKKQIFEQMMLERESMYVKDYFERQKISADVQIIK